VQAKKVLLLFAVMLALASAAAIGTIMPTDYPTPPAIAPEQSVPTAAQAPVPLTAAPGHPGAMYTQIVMTAYGSIHLANPTCTDGDAIGVYTHVAPDSLSAIIQYTADTRDDIKSSIDIYDDRDSNGLIYITVNTQPGVEVGLSVSDNNDDIHHVSPGVYLAKADSGDDKVDLDITIYGNPITSGDRSVSLTFTAQ